MQNVMQELKVARIIILRLHLLWLSYRMLLCLQIP